MPLHILIEGLLFYKSAPQKKSLLMKIFDVDEEKLNQSLNELKQRLQTGAMRLIETDNEIQLVTAPELSKFVNTLRKQEIKAEIGKAGAETLAIILYKGEVTRAEIDRIRGVNSSFILRNLLVRGLVERKTDQKRSSYVFAPSIDLLAHLGITHRHELQDFSTIMNSLEQFETETDTP